jgi:general secretion pathway protein D
MSSVVRVWSVAAVLALVAVPAAVAQSEAFKSAVQLYERQDYVGAQQALLKLDRASLSDEERERFDELLAKLPEAIQGSEKAGQDLLAANAAYEAGEWETADRLYQAVGDNKFAGSGMRDVALQQHNRILEKKKLADAARPQGTVEEHRETRVVEQTKAGPVHEVGAQPAGSPPTSAAPAVPAAPAAPADSVAEMPQRLTPTGQLRLRDDLQWQRAVAQATTLANKAREAIAGNDFAAAKQDADAALQTIEAAAKYAEPVAKYETAKAEMQDLQKEVEQARAEFERANATKEREEIANRIKVRKQLLEQQKQESVQQLFNQAEQLRRERRFDEASEVLRQILRIDPGNAKARYQLDVSEDYGAFGRQDQIDRDKGAEQRRALQQADESLIPWDYDVVYPKNWLELTARRTAEGVQTGAKFEDVELNRKLDETLPEVRFDETPFEQVIDFLTELTKTNISVDWTNLNDSLLTGNAREKPVSIKLTNPKLRTVLKEILAQVGGETQLSFAVGDGLLRIATKDKLNKDKLILIYDVRDLLATVPQAGRPDFSQNNQGLSSSGTSGGGGSGQSVFGNTNQNQNQQQQDQQGGQAEMQKLKEIIRGAVEPDSWVEAGAGTSGGSIQDLNGQLLIYNTSDAHRQVVDLLKQLRETQALQVSVEARFLDVVNNFLEQFGVDLDFVFNSGSAGYDRAPDLVDPFTGAPVLIPRTYSRIGSVPATPAYGVPMAQTTPGQPYGNAGLIPRSSGMLPTWDEATPISAQQSSMSLVDPSGINTGVPGSWSQRGGTSPALNIAGSFLDNLQVDFLIRATQANARSSIVQAPRAVLLNGQAVEIRVESVRRYIASLEPVVGENAALPRPVPADANAGTSMWVQAVISADRRYTKLSIALLQQSEPEFERYELQRGSGNSPSIFLLLPRQNRITYTTTVSIPDGGTVLLGGFKQAAEVELEAGVPILSKIPVLKRAFTNTSTVKDTRTLLILVKAKILIQKEAEEEAFPTFTRGS